MTFGERLTALRKENGYTTRNEFAEKLGIPSTTLRNYETDVREPGHTFLIEISKLFNVSIDYLLCISNEKEIIKPYELKSSEFSHIEKYRSIDDFGRETVSYILDRELSRVKSQKNEKRIKIKTGTLVDFHEIQESKPKLRAVKTTLQSLSAGTGSIGDDDQLAEINYPDEKVPDGTELASKINGDSMEPTYFDGDIVFYELTCHLNEGDIGVFRKNGENFIKEYSRKGLISHNPAYKMIVPGMDDHIETIGKVLGKL